MRGLKTSCWPCRACGACGAAGGIIGVPWPGEAAKGPAEEAAAAARALSGPEGTTLPGPAGGPLTSTGA